METIYNKDRSVRFIKCTKEQYETAKRQNKLNENWFYYVIEKENKNEEQV